jgi:hypothetical protein
MYLNGWIAIFQLLFSLPLMIPAALASDPPVQPAGLPQNLWNGLLCFFGINSIECDDDDNCTPDDCYPQAPMFVTCYLFFNQLYNLLIILILKYGSANILFLVSFSLLLQMPALNHAYLIKSQALTLMVPLGNVVS